MARSRLGSPSASALPSSARNDVLGAELMQAPAIFDGDCPGTVENSDAQADSLPFQTAYAAR